jgi:hypothetical protein
MIISGADILTSFLCRAAPVLAAPPAIIDAGKDAAAGPRQNLFLTSPLWGCIRGGLRP